MQLKILKTYLGLIIQTNLSPALNDNGLTQFQIGLYYLQLSYFLLNSEMIQVLGLVKSITSYVLLIPLYTTNYYTQTIVGILLLILNLMPYSIALYRLSNQSKKQTESVQKGLLQIPTLFINYYFLYFTWFLFIPQLCYAGVNLVSEDIVLIIIGSIIISITMVSLLISNCYFNNFEFNERNLKKHFSYNNVISQYLIVLIVMLQYDNDATVIIARRIINGLMVVMQFYEAIILSPYGYSDYGTIYAKTFISYSSLYVITTLMLLFNFDDYTATILLIFLQPLIQSTLQMWLDSQRISMYAKVDNQNQVNQFYDIIYIENLFQLSLRAARDKRSEIELITIFSAHREHCKITVCQCSSIQFSKIKKLDKIVLFIQCLFKRSFSKNNKSLQIKHVTEFEMISLKYLTFINKFKNNAPKTYQELKILFQKKQDYSFYFIKLCQILQYKLQTQIKKDEDYNINSESKNRISNVKLQISRNERGIAQSLYQMEQVRVHFLPLIIQVCQVKANFWRHYWQGRISSYSQVEQSVEELYELKQNITREYLKYKNIFFQNGKTYNVQFLKFTALMQLTLYNNPIKYILIEKHCKEIIDYEKGQNFNEITNISLLKGQSITLKLCIALGPNIGKIQNKVITPLIPKFFGFDDQNSIQAFLAYTGGNVNPLLPDWISPIHDEIMQNYIRRGHTARIGKYFNTFIKLYDKTLARVQVYLANNFNSQLEADFAMIGCVRKIDCDENEEAEDEQPSGNLKDNVFKNEQYILFDVHGNILGITTGIFQMIRRLQRKNEMQVMSQNCLRKQSSQISSDSKIEDNQNHVNWSEEELTIDNFYQHALIWMILPHISKEIEATGIEYLKYGQRAPKGREATIDLEHTNEIISQQQTIIRVPEDLLLFANEYGRIMQRVVEDERVQQSQASIYKSNKDHYSHQDSEVRKNKAVPSLFNEKLCHTFYEEIFKNRDQIKSKREFISKTSLQMEQGEEDIFETFADKYSRYIRNFTYQKNIHSIPIIYSINYEEYMYKKNEVDNKIQMFVVQMIVNDQQVQHIERENMRKLRETIKTTFNGSVFNKMSQKQSHISDDSISAQLDFSEKYSAGSLDIDCYHLTSKPIQRMDSLNSLEKYNDNQIPEENSATIRKGKAIRLKTITNAHSDLRIDSKRNLSKNRDSFKKLNFAERDIASNVIKRIQQRKKQQVFYADNYSKNSQQSKDKQEYMTKEAEHYQNSLQLLESSFENIKFILQNYRFPKYFNLQVYLQAIILLFIVSFVILVAVVVSNQHDYSNCTNSLEIMLSLQKYYSLTSQGLFHNYIVTKFSIDHSDKVHTFYQNQIAEGTNKFWLEYTQNMHAISQSKLRLEQLYNNNLELAVDTSLLAALQLISSNFYEIKNNASVTSVADDQHMIDMIWMNLKEVSKLVDYSYDSCYFNNISSENRVQQLLIVYIVLIFVVVFILMVIHIPMFFKISKYQKQIYRFIMQVSGSMIEQEMNTYNTITQLLQYSIYEWMSMDFLTIGKFLEVDKQIDESGGVITGRDTQTELKHLINAKTQKKLFKKINQSQFKIFKQLALLILEILMILVYFILIFAFIYLLSNELFYMEELLFKFRLVQSSFLSTISNADLIAYNSVSNNSILNIMSQSDFQLYSRELEGVSHDFYLQFSNTLMSSLIGTADSDALTSMNQYNICDIKDGLDCLSMNLYTIDPESIYYYQFGMKYLMTQVSKLIQQQPQFYSNDSMPTNVDEFINYITSLEHYIYIDYGTEILVDAYSRILIIGNQQFHIAVQAYKQLILLLTFCVGSFTLIVSLVLGQTLIRMQRKSIQICITSILLLSPKRYMDKSIWILTKRL